ncbi:hypothetical protein ABW19_dt0209031 [Dactylella cylindrospora]|nr:hypothetical protein ABW19_dt0209031 [Dactylella cylindrospora]
MDFSSFPSSQSPDSALAVVLPESCVDVVQPFRSVYDAAALKWPPHLNLFYPFVNADFLGPASEFIDDQLKAFWKSPVYIRFGYVEVFAGGKKRPSFLVLRPDKKSEQELQRIYTHLCGMFPDVAKDVKRPFKPHLTIGQVYRGNEGKLKSLKTKLEILCRRIGRVKLGLATMRRLEGKMRYVRSWDIEEYDVHLSPECVPGTITKRDTWTPSPLFDNNKIAIADDSEDEAWVKMDPKLEIERTPGRSFTLSSFNVFFDYDNIEGSDDRWWVVCKKILTLKSAIICLQEVSDALFEVIREDEDIRLKYPYISHSPDRPLLRHQNCVILSSIPFTWEELASTQQGRSIGFAKFEQLGYYTIKQAEAKIEVAGGEDEAEEPTKVWNPLIVCNVHLPAYLMDETIKIRSSYTEDLKAHLTKYYPSNPVLVVGDTNIPNDEIIEYAVKHKIIEASSGAQYAQLFPETEYLDAWKIAGEGLDGSTFDPTNNPLAHSSSQSGSSVPVQPQRYDRVYLRKQGGDNLLIRETRVDREEYDALISDHYILSTKLSFIDDERKIDAAAMLELPETSLTDNELRELLIRNNCFPTEAESEVREYALASLRACLQGADRLDATVINETFKFRMAPVGSYGLGTHDSNSDIDCLVVGNISSNLFWQVAKRRIKQWQAHSTTTESSKLAIKIVRYVDAAIPMLILLIGDKVRIDLQYCTAGRIVEDWDKIPTLPFNSPAFNLTVPTLKKLQAYRDMLFILQRVPNLATFRLAYRFIKLWASNKGIYSSKFGFIGGIHITLLLARVCMLLPPQATATQLLFTFFKQYSKWKWVSDTVTIPNTGRTLRYQRAARDKMVILTINTPAVNVAANATSHTVNTLAVELDQACAKFELDASLPEIIGAIGDSNTSLTSSVNDFLTGYNRYIKVDIQFWGTSRQNGRALVGWVESRLVMLLTELGKQTPALTARIWPRRFHEAKANQEADPASSERSELRGFYLIGLAPSPASADMSKEDKRNGEAVFASVLQDFEGRVKHPGKFDEKEMWISIECIKAANLVAEDGNVVQEDNTMIWDGGEADEEGDSIPDEDSSEEEEEIAQDLLGAASSDDQFWESIRNRKKPKAKSTSPQRNSSPAKPKAKLRPSHEVYHRIKWDNTYDSSNYLVGYEDRFRGVLELPVDKWKMEMSDEEFVPMHRVVYFKEKKSGEVVWDREKRIDKIFGSGASK